MPILANAVRIHTFNGFVIVNGADGKLGAVQAKALGLELQAWVKHLQARKYPTTRLVHPDGRRTTESTGRPAWRFI